MSNPIQFLLHQLATNEQDRERYNKVTMELYIEPDGTFWNPLFGKAKVENLHDQQVVNFIRTCLSRVNGVDGEAVLSIFQNYRIKLNCYLAFDYPLRNGKPLDEAIQALHDKILE